MKLVGPDEPKPEGSRSEPWKPVKYNARDVAAIQALTTGTADADQQRHAIEWIVTVISGVYQPSFYPGGEDGRRKSDFAEGKRFIGNTILKMVNRNLSTVQEQDNAEKLV
jgi:hypothetical protein